MTDRGACAGRRWFTGPLLVASATLVALCVWCGWASAPRRGTDMGLLTWCLSLGIVAGIHLYLRHDAKGRQLRRWLRGDLALLPASGTKSTLACFVPWILLVLAVLTWELLGIDTGPTTPHLTISALIEVFRPLRAAMLLLWMVAGIAHALGNGHSRPFRDDAQQLPAEVLALWALRSPGLLLPANRYGGVAFWILVAAIAIGIEVASRHRPGRGRVAGVKDVFDALSANRVVEFAVVAAWVFAGVHLFA